MKYLANSDFSARGSPLFSSEIQCHSKRRKDIQAPPREASCATVFLPSSGVSDGRCEELHRSGPTGVSAGEEDHGQAHTQSFCPVPGRGEPLQKEISFPRDACPGKRENSPSAKSTSRPRHLSHSTRRAAAKESRQSTQRKTTASQKRKQHTSERKKESGNPKRRKTRIPKAAPNSKTETL